MAQRILTGFILASCLLFILLENSIAQSISAAVDKAIKDARIRLSHELIKETPTAGILMETHSYVKLNALTELIGLKSNENFLAYEDLLTQGYSNEIVLQNLRSRRLEICTKPLAGKCDRSALYRTINGTCNNLQFPLWGSILEPFRRLRPSSYSDNYNQPRGGRVMSTLPNVRVVSSTIVEDRIVPDPTITNFVPQFGQFLDHDLTLTPEGDKHCCSTSMDTDCWSIPVFSNDTFYSTLKKPQQCLDFTRSTAYCFPTETGVREQMNILTAYADASNLYGSDDERTFQLREFSQGRLRVNKNNPNLLPLVKDVEEIIGEEIMFMGDFLAGDERVNEMPALATMHTLMVREHNRIADEVFERQPNWSDEKIFQETRRLVIAEWQNVVYAEYLPLILGANTMRTFGLSLPPPGQYSIYDPLADATMFHSFSTAAYRFGHTLINGLVKLMRGLMEVGSYHVRDNFFESHQLTQDCGDGYELILSGLMTQNAQVYDEFVTEDLTNFLLRDNANDFGSDLVARNLQRGRDHGLQGYNEYRKICGLVSLTSSWNDRPSEIRPEAWEKMSSLYASPFDIDLFVAGIAEFPLAGAVSGPTFNCIKAIQFQRVKNGDRFFFTHSAAPLPFTPAHLQILRQRTLRDIICDNSKVEATPLNVFRTVDEGGVSNPRKACDDAYARNYLKAADFV